jgi:predicted nucleic acid-binding Zn ribbon protein
MSRFTLPAPTPPEEIEKALSRSAELRANGASWKTCARVVNLPAGELKALARTWKPTYRQHLAEARAEVFEDSMAESVLRLRRQLRSLREPVAQKAADVLVRIWATRLRHRKANPRPGLPEGVTKENLEIARYFGSMTAEPFSWPPSQLKTTNEGADS